MVAARAAVSVGAHSTSQGEIALREAIAQRLRDEGIRTGLDRLLITNGAMQGLDICFRTLLSPGEEVLMPHPGFFIQGIVGRAGGVVRGFPSPEGDGFRPDWDSAQKQITNRTRILFINSPVNPTGYVYTRDDVERALQLAQAHDMWIISDESYSRFVYRGLKHGSVASLPGAEHRTILIRSFSKDYAMSAWRLGYVSMPFPLVNRLVRALEWSCLSVNRVAQAAGLAALTGPDDWIRRFVADAERHATVFPDALNAMEGMRCQRPGGGLNILVGFDGPIDDIVERLVLEGGVPVHPGEAFGAPGYFRIQFGATDAALELARERIASVLDDRAHLAARGGRGVPQYRGAPRMG